MNPQRLLMALSFALSPGGGIRAIDDVARISSMMKRFSKKLVSRSLYCSILQATQPNILEEFLNNGGWDIICRWLHVAKSSSSSSFLLELIKLCKLLPLTFKSIEQNNVMKVIISLTDHENSDVKTFSLELLCKWMPIFIRKDAVPTYGYFCSESSQGLCKPTSCQSPPKGHRMELLREGTPHNIKALVSLPFINNSAISVPHLLHTEERKPLAEVNRQNYGSSPQETGFTQNKIKSKRKTRVRKRAEQKKAIEEAILTSREDGFEVKYFSTKGRGIVTVKDIKKDDFVLEYAGELVTHREAVRREIIYRQIDNIGCFMYYFKHGDKKYCVDATCETHRLGRLVNHSKKGNLTTRVHVVKQRPHLVFLASRDIWAGEELLYDYGERRKPVLQALPWLST